MKILFIVPSYKPAYMYGGTVVVIAKLAEGLASLGHDVTIYTTAANGKSELDVEIGKEITIDGVKITYFGRITGDHTHVSPSLWRQLNQTVKDFDVVHIHSWWNFLVVVSAWICTRKGVKPVLSPHGMFSEYILTTRNKEKKKWLQTLLGKRLLRNTTLHVSTRMEEDEAQKLVPDWPAVIIPNLVQLPDRVYPRLKDDVFTIGFLSRIDAKKGLDILIQALGKVNFPYKLLIGGSGESDYIESLKQLSKECGTTDHIEWVGWKSETEKFVFLSEIDLFALISHSENFAVVVIESLSVGTPVLISNQVGLYEYILARNCGWVCETDVDRAARKLDEAYRDTEKAQYVNKCGRALIRSDYNDFNLTNKYIKFYETIRHSI